VGIVKHSGELTMPKATLYVKDADAATWERAKALTGDTEESLSSVVSELLRSYVERQETLRSAEETFFHDLNSSSRPIVVDWLHILQDRRRMKIETSHLHSTRGVRNLPADHLAPGWR
jgi:hypothetical protein